MATFVPFTHWLPVRAEQLEFGRSKKEGMPKTKKKTVEVLETSSTVEVDTAMRKIVSELSNRGREPQGAVGDRSKGHGEPARCRLSSSVAEEPSTVPASANARPAMGCAGRSTGHCVARACALPCASSVSEHALAAVGTDVATLCSALDASETWAE